MQGVAISRAMYFKASLVILDEPTTALAVSGVKQVLDFISRLKDSGIACLFVSHNLHDVYAAADRIVVLDKGKIIEEGTFGELLLQKGEFYNLYKLQFRHEEQNKNNYI